MKGLWVLIVTLGLTACSALPVIQPAPAEVRKAACPSLFAESPIRYIHAIEARAAGKTQAVMIGVTLVHPRTRTISSAIVSAEGVSLFEATSSAGEVKVNRALPPFDSPDFAKNMMHDIELIFLAPHGTPKQHGLLADGRAVCRWHQEQGGWVDISNGADQHIRIQRYSEGGKPERAVTLTANADNPYATIVLQASDLINYTLIMTLIESETVNSEPPASRSSGGNLP